jgi:CRP/FNR family cyclic AMP-dependent transcriptional regulator
MSTLETMLRGSLWAAALSADELDDVVRESSERRVSIGGYAMRCGEPADQWIGVIDGLVKMSVSQSDGRHSTFTGVTAGGWAGEGSLLKAGRWRYDGVAVRHTRLACVPRHAFERLVSTNLAFNRFLLSQLNARLSLFVGLVEYDRLMGPDARVARCLASLFDPDLYPRAGSFVQLSQEEIGLLSAVSRQRANEALHGLERAGLLRIEFGGVTVLDLPGLRGYCDASQVRPANKLGVAASRL